MKLDLARPARPSRNPVAAASAAAPAAARVDAPRPRAHLSAVNDRRAAHRRALLAGRQASARRMQAPCFAPLHAPLARGRATGARSKFTTAVPSMPASPRPRGACAPRRRCLLSMSGPDPSTPPETPQAPFDLPNAPDDPTRNDGRATAGMFGIRIQTNGDVIKFGFVAIAVAYTFKFGLTSFGVRDILAGQITTGIVSVASLVAWVST
jgi:hypothetical protein